MAHEVEIFCVNTKQKHWVKEGSGLTEIAHQLAIDLQYPIVGALVNNELRELAFRVFKPKTIRFIDGTSIDGHRMYIRSLMFILRKATQDVAQSAIHVHHSVSNGLYVELADAKMLLNSELIMAIKTRMRELIEADFPFLSSLILTRDAADIFKQRGMTDRATLFEHRKQLYTTVYQLDNMIDYFYGYLLPSTRYVHTFDLLPYFEGMLLLYPKVNSPRELPRIINQSKMFDIVREHKNWLEILNLSNVGSINTIIRNRQEGDLIKVSEALHEKKIAEIAEKIAQRKHDVRVVLISGPSSSGKTTFSKRLEVQLKVAGIQPVSISLDNYFVDRELTPRDENGEYNFEALEAIDIDAFNQDLLRLMEGEEISLPTFDFKTGKRQYNGERLRVNAQQIILIEGIHGLNPGLTPHIARESTYRIYVSALTQINMDKHNRIPSTDHRLIRRIVRDFKYRKYSAYETLKRWPSVRLGEDKNIFPFQEQADIMFNSSLMYELCVLKSQAEPLLSAVQQSSEEYAEARRLLKFLEYFEPVSKDEVPPTSILREFVGGSSFKY